MNANFISGYINSGAGQVPVVSTKLSLKDKLGTVMVRSSINRDNYKVEPGLYAVGSPNENSDVLVSANYKLSFDTLRKNLDGLNVWILVLDTKGINVWCAAGKGTFGTKELVNRIKLTSLDKVVSHRRIILPQLGAPGVAAHSVKCPTGFNVTYGPVRANDIKEFIQSNYHATKEMRRVNFGLFDRLVLVPVDFFYRFPLLIGILLLILAAYGISRDGISFQNSISNGLPVVRNIFLAYCAGIVFTPILLPYIPVRSFTLKGIFTGLLLFIILFLTNNAGNNLFDYLTWLLFIPGLSSFVAMNFTGSSTYTSLSGVKKEMKFGVPLQIALTSISVVLFIVGKII